MWLTMGDTTIHARDLAWSHIGQTVTATGKLSRWPTVRAPERTGILLAYDMQEDHVDLWITDEDPDAVWWLELDDQITLTPREGNMDSDETYYIGPETFGEPTQEELDAELYPDAEPFNGTIVFRCDFPSPESPERCTNTAGVAGEHTEYTVAAFQEARKSLALGARWAYRNGMDLCPKHRDEAL